MRKGFCCLMAGAVALVLTACALDSSGNGIIQDDGTEKNLKEVTFDTITEENMEYYSYRSGSSSLSEEFAVYEYKGEFVFAADYFHCGDELLETRVLSEEEKKLFFEKVNAVSVSPEAADKGSDYRDGAHTEHGSMTVNGSCYSVGMIDFESIGMTIKDASEAEYPMEEETEGYEIEGIFELQELAQWKEKHISVTTEEFERSVGKQIEDRLGEEIERMVIDSSRDEDFVIKAETKEGGGYVVTVTYFGYVAEVEKE